MVNSALTSSQMGQSSIQIFVCSPLLVRKTGSAQRTGLLCSSSKIWGHFRKPLGLRSCRKNICYFLVFLEKEAFACFYLRYSVKGVRNERHRKKVPEESEDGLRLDRRPVSEARYCNLAL